MPSMAISPGVSSIPSPEQKPDSQSLCARHDWYNAATAVLLAAVGEDVRGDVAVTVGDEVGAGGLSPKTKTKKNISTNSEHTSA